MSEPDPTELAGERSESKAEHTSLTSTEGESDGGAVTQIEVFKLFDDNNESELNALTEYAKSISGSVGPQETSSSAAAAAKYQIEGDAEGLESQNARDGEDKDFGQDPGDDDEEDDTLSSEAFVDDIELILMPEGTEDLPDDRDSPKLVRVTELRSQADEDYEDYEEDDCDFRKMDISEKSDRDNNMTPSANLGDNSGDECEYDEEEQEGAVGITHSISKSEVYISFEEDDQSFSHHSAGGQQRSKKSRTKKMHSGVQTDITALEKDYSDQQSFDFKSRKVYLGGSAKGGSGSGSARTSHPVKKLNWKSELTLLPSKTKIGYGFDGPSYGALIRASDDRDQYSQRVTKFTSQDNVLSSSSQFLKPSTLYRTRNLSRNLNHFGSSETTLVLPMTETTTTESTRYRERIHSGAAGAGAAVPSGSFKGAPASQQSHHLSHQSSYTPRSSLYSTIPAKNFRSSLPDLSSSGGMHHHDNKRRQSQKSMRNSLLLGNSSSSSGFRGHKKSSSDEETSSLIDESERCLRSSIDLLLTDDFPSPGSNYPYHHRHFGSGPFRGSYSARRSCSQPILTDQGYCGEPRDTLMGSPFLPRKLSDMRCSKWAKVILPNGQVSVVAVRETDEVRDVLSVHTNSGALIDLPFRKVVFAWRLKR